MADSHPLYFCHPNVSYDDYIVEEADDVIAACWTDFLPEMQQLDADDSDDPTDHQDLPDAVDSTISEREFYFNDNDAVIVLRESENAEEFEDSEVTTRAAMCAESDLRAKASEFYGLLMAATVEALQEAVEAYESETSVMEQELSELEVQADSLDDVPSELTERIDKLSDQIDDRDPDNCKLTDEQLEKIFDKIRTDFIGVDPAVIIIPQYTLQELNQLKVFLAKSREVGYRGDGPLGSAYIDSRCGVQLDGDLAYIKFHRKVARAMPYHEGVYTGKLEDHLIAHCADTDRNDRVVVSRVAVTNVLADVLGNRGLCHELVIALEAEVDGCDQLVDLVQNLSEGEKLTEEQLWYLRTVVQPARTALKDHGCCIYLDALYVKLMIETISLA